MREKPGATAFLSMGKVLWTAALILAASAALWLSRLYSYLLFHSIAEVFSIVIASSVFMISWNSRESSEARPLVLLGIGYLFVGFIDLFHTLSYEGMNVLADVRDYPTKLWVAARGLQAVTTLAFAVLMRLKRKAPHALVFAIGAAATAVLLASIFWWDIFPLCFVEGKGVTPFKKASEYAVSALLAAAIVLVAGEREAVNRRVRNLLISAFGLTILSELVFTLYTSSYGIENLIGHYLKIASFFLTYQALIATEVRKRIAMIEELERAKKALEKTDAELRKANLSKDKFFSIIAHDLKNPLGGLLTIAEVLAKSFDHLGEAKIKELCALMRDGAHQGMDLVESILQWARASTGKIACRPKPIALEAVCRQAVEILRAAAENKEIGVSLRIDKEMNAFADEDMLCTVVRNLLSNAVKFTPRGGEVVISAADRGDCVELSVADTGIGMSGQELEKLFRIDAQFTNKGTEDERGSGLGLIICKEFVELNHATMLATSEPGAGSTFTVRLPKEQSASAE